MGVSSAVLSIIRTGRTDNGSNIATVDDHQVGVNFVSFTMCMSTNNPAVQAATSAAGGVFTPAPCVPNVTQRWSNASSMTLDGAALITSRSTCACQWGGTISVAQSNSTVAVP